MNIIMMILLIIIMTIIVMILVILKLIINTDRSGKARHVPRQLVHLEIKSNDNNWKY